MTPRIVTLSSKKLVGKRLIMTLSDNKTADLWRSFMPIRKEIHNAINEQLFSLQLYPSNFFYNFNPNTRFEKWAAIEVVDFENVPFDLETFYLASGLYAVFLYKGLSSSASETFQFIYSKWLPSSEYSLDDRPHFELLGDKYKNDDPSSEEEIWIPIKPKI